MKGLLSGLTRALGLVVLVATTARAQLATGNVYGTVRDESGAVLPGANVVLSGATIGSRGTTSGAHGDFRFLTLDPGTYRVTVSLTGFGAVAREVVVNTGTNVNLTFDLKVQSVEETVTITAQTPVVDPKKSGTSTTMTREELHQIPNSRDPWAVLRTVPGVLVDRVNIAGNESGQQSIFTGKGANPADTVWTLDGVVITDTAAAGASPVYFDFDAFEEINVSTGGAALRVATGGVSLNFVTKRGTNEFRGSIRGFFTHDDLQSSNIPTELENDPRLVLPDGTRSDKADHIQQIADYGADLGGPIVKDKLWFWGAYGRQDIRTVRTNQTADRTILEDYNGKIHWQATRNDTISVAYFNGIKEKFGRPAIGSGLGLQEEDGALWNQGQLYPGPLHGLFKGEINHVFGPSFFLNAKYGYFGTGFFLSPRGGLEREAVLDFDQGVARNSTLFFGSERPQHVATLDGNYFFSGVGGTHELKFGFGYRKTPVRSSSAWGGSKILTVKYDPTGGIAQVTRDRLASYETEYWSGYVGDTFSKGRLTLSAGARVDYQKGGNRPSEASANPAFPQLLPGLEFDGSGQGIDVTDVSPRASLSLALDDSRRTLLRASYARYAGQLTGAEVSYDNPIGSVSYLAYNWRDRNGDGIAQRDEVLLGEGIQYYGFVDPANPSNVTSPNRIDPDYSVGHDDEVIVGLDRELLPNFAVSAAYTWRRGTDSTFWTPRIGLTSADYTANPPVTRNGFTGVTYSPNPALVATTGGGRILTNRPDYSTSFNGVELTLNKRLSNKWMARVAFSYNDWTESLEGPAAVQNPTRTDSSTQGTVSGFAGPQVDGGQVAPRSTGSGKGDIFYNAKWQLTASALYQLPLGFEVAGSLFSRQGYPRPIILVLNAGNDGRVRTLATSEVDTERYPDLWNLDLRLSKTFNTGRGTSLIATADLFNAFNDDVELNRNRQASSSAFGRLDEVLSPRIFRFGLRFAF